MTRRHANPRRRWGPLALLALLAALFASGTPSVGSQPAAPQDLRVTSGTLIVLGEVLRLPVAIEVVQDDVLIDGASLAQRIESARAAAAVPVDVPAKYVERHQTVVSIGDRFDELRAQWDLERTLTELVPFAEAQPQVARATHDGYSMQLTWIDGVTEELVLEDIGPADVPSSTPETLGWDLQHYASILERGGVLALGVNYIVSATGSQADQLRETLDRVLDDDYTHEAAELELELLTGGRAFPVDFVDTNKR